VTTTTTRTTTTTYDVIDFTFLLFLLFQISDILLHFQMRAAQNHLGSVSEISGSINEALPTTDIPEYSTFNGRLLRGC